MTNIVIKRETVVNDTNTDSNINNINSNDKLSLSYLLNIIDGTISPENTLFVITTNHLEKLDSALVRYGRIDLNIILTKCTKYQLGKIYKDMYNKKLDEIILNKFPEEKYITAHVILYLFQNMHNENINLNDLFSEFISL
jgi:ATP-dependent Zn protease